MYNMWERPVNGIECPDDLKCQNTFFCMIYFGEVAVQGNGIPHTGRVGWMDPDMGYFANTADISEQFVVVVDFP